MSKEEIEGSIEYKFNNFYNDDTLKLTTEEAKYIFSGQNMFCDAVIDAGAKTLIQYIERLEQENNKLNKIIDEMVEEYEYNARCNLNNFCDEEMRKDKCIQDCRICIKQYFEKKVEGK